MSCCGNTIRGDDENAGEIRGDRKKPSWWVLIIVISLIIMFVIGFIL